MIALAGLALFSAVYVRASIRVCARLLSPAFLTLGEEEGAGLTVVAVRRLPSFRRLAPASAPVASSSPSLAIIYFVLAAAIPAPFSVMAGPCVAFQSDPFHI